MCKQKLLTPRAAGYAFVASVPTVFWLRTDEAEFAWPPEGFDGLSILFRTCELPPISYLQAPVDEVEDRRKALAAEMLVAPDTPHHSLLTAACKVRRQSYQSLPRVRVFLEQSRLVFCNLDQNPHKVAMCNDKLFCLMRNGHIYAFGQPGADRLMLGNEHLASMFNPVWKHCLEGTGLESMWPLIRCYPLSDAAKKTLAGNGMHVIVMSNIFQYVFSKVKQRRLLMPEIARSPSLALAPSSSSSQSSSTLTKYMKPGMTPELIPADTDEKDALDQRIDEDDNLFDTLFASL